MPDDSEESGQLEKASKADESSSSNRLTDTELLSEQPVQRILDGMISVVSTRAAGRLGSIFRGCLLLLPGEHSVQETEGS